MRPFVIPAAALAALATLVGSAFGAATFAHYMAVQATYYTDDDWKGEMQLAQSIGIQGFILNVAVESYELGQTALAYSVAESVPGFQLFLSFDMSSDWTADQIVSYVQNTSSSSAQYKWGGDVLVTAYCTTSECIGTDTYDDAFWSGIKSNLSDSDITISLAPAFTYYRDPSLASQLLSDYPSIDGFANWWSWPDDTDTNLTTATDVAYQSAINGNRTGPYIMGVSAWQFKDLDSTAWVEYSDTLIDYRWQQAIQLNPDIVEIITWNDYGESHYIGPVKSDVVQDSYSLLYTENITHYGWRTVMQYYIAEYMNGTAPAVSGDTLVYWYRIYPKDLTCDEGWQPRFYTYPADEIFVWALLESDGTVSASIGSSDVQTINFTVSAGTPTMGALPFSTDDAQTPSFQVSHSGSVSATGQGNVSISTSSCPMYNFNPQTGLITS